MKNIFLGIPRISDFRIRIYHSKYLHLSALFIKHGYSVQLYDENLENSSYCLSDKILESKPEIVIIYFFKSDLLKYKISNKLINDLKRVKNSVSNISIIGIGYIAEAYKEYLVNDTNSVDFIVSQSTFFFNQKNDRPKKPLEEINIIQKYYQNFYTLTRDAVDRLNYQPSANSTLSLFSSIGCDNNCTFCGYNLNTPNRIVRPIIKLVDEISFFENNYSVKRIILSDTSFCNSEEEAWKRLSEFVKYKNDRKIKSVLTINIPLSALSNRVVVQLKLAGCINLLIGLESFNPNTLKQFNKHVNLDKLFDIVTSCDDAQIACQLSYIMFHPWQTIKSLRHEISLIEKIGRNRIPQFLSNSILFVIPNTAIERYLKNKKWITRQNETETLFKFQDSKVDEIYHKLKNYYDSHIEHTDYKISKLKELKVKEWNYLKKMIT